MNEPVSNDHAPESGTVSQEYTSYEEFYEAIPIDGSLGILALGAVGVLAWKRKRFDSGWQVPEPVYPEAFMKRVKAAAQKRKKEDSDG
ncbi:hypothetical protein JW948_09700 [bacterium]|nr:hypothetical protein [bacterium]